MAFIVAMAAGCGAIAPAMADVVVHGLRIGQHGAFTRFVLDVSQELRPAISTLADPYRVVIDLPAIKWRLPGGVPAGGGVIASYRYGAFTAGTERLVLDTTGPVAVAKFFHLPASEGHGVRLVIDLAPVAAAAFSAKSASGTGGTGGSQRTLGRVLVAPPAPPPPAPPPRVARRGAGDLRPMIVIDPGHGGIDPGAIGRGGTFEKDLTLAVSRELARQLRASGRYRVGLTRESDIFIRLRDRIAIARAKGADLFLSVHADSIDNPSIRGATVYTLSEKASDTEAEQIAARENKADLIAGVDLTEEQPEVVNILIDLAQRETMNASSVFARLLSGEIGTTGRLNRNAHRFAGFAVLKAPDVPSVLLELGYLSNPSDEKLLGDASHQARLGRAVVRSIDRYFERQQAQIRP